MNQIPVIGFSAYSNTGKTTLIEKLIPVLKQKGLRLAVLKHDAHRFQIDYEGKDSWRFTKAGAEVILLGSMEKSAAIYMGFHDFKELLSSIRGVDLILVEGYKNQDIPRIGIARKATGQGFPEEISHYAALVTDDEIETEIPCFGLEDADGISRFIVELLGLEGNAAAESRKLPAPSVDQWLREAKADPAASPAGVYLTCHETAHSAGEAVRYDGAELAAVLEEAKQMPGIFCVRVWRNEGQPAAGEDVLCVLIGGDSWTHAASGLQYLVDRLTKV